MKRLVLASIFMLGSASAEAQKPTYADELNRDMQMASVITVSDGGDIDLFGGSVVVPSTRPSVERCGEHMSLSAVGRTAAMRKARSDANDLAIKRRFSPRERHEYGRKAAAPLKACEEKFKARCTEIRESVDLASRKAAVEQAKQTIDRLAKGPQEKATVAKYLENVLAACPLTE